VTEPIKSDIRSSKFTFETSSHNLKTNLNILVIFKLFYFVFHFLKTLDYF